MNRKIKKVLITRGQKPKRPGFTLIEVLMVILIVAIISAVALPQFQNYRLEARRAAFRNNLASIRAGITLQHQQSIVRCNATGELYPTAATLSTNTVVAGLATGGVDWPCEDDDPKIMGNTYADTISDLYGANSLDFVQGGIPNNPWGCDDSVNPGSCTVGALGSGEFPTNTITDCDVAIECITHCSVGAAMADCTGLSGGWCYDVVLGEIWADSRYDTADPETGGSGECAL